MTKETAIGITLGTDTETFLSAVLEDLDDETLDQIEIERGLEKSEGLAGEPITTGVIIAASAMVMSAVLRVIERHMEAQRQLKAMNVVAEGFEKDPNLGNLLAEMAKKHADVAISYGIAKEAWPNPEGPNPEE